jgi:hypothetical protein
MEYINPEDYGMPRPPLKGLPDAVVSKLRAAAPILKASYSIPLEKYKTVYATSDIHSDLYAIANILFVAGLTTGNLDTESLFNIRWNPNARETLVVIAGDIVDGKRSWVEVYDLIGDIEIGLHIFLFNLRVSARQYGSELRFTIGNHDFLTVFNPSSRFEEFIHSSALSFFGDMVNRAECLIEFYKCCPYLCVTVGKELMFVHASYHNPHTNGEMDGILEIQEEIDEADYDSVLEKITPKFFDFVNAIDSRVYSVKSSDVICKAVKESQYRLIVVGHCQTNSCSKFGGTMSEIMSQNEYKGCEKGGCVVIGCNDTRGPHLAFVDISMSGAFRNRPGYEAIRYEVLKLELNPTIQKVSRLNITADGSDSSEDIVVWKESESPLANTQCTGPSCSLMGGRRKRKTNRKGKLHGTKKMKLKRKE